jgi:hypothetical protein
MRRMSHRVKTTLFWVCLGAAALIFVLSVKWDMSGDAQLCGVASEGRSAFLVLQEIDTGAGEIKAQLMVPDYVADKDELVLESVSKRLEKNAQGYHFQPLLYLKPGERPKSGGTWHQVRIPYKSNPYLYPFERYTMNLHVSLSKNIGIGEDEGEIPIKLQVSDDIVELVPYRCLDHYSFEGEGTSENAFAVTFIRHRFVIVTFAILYTIAGFFLIYIWQRGETSAVMTNSLGYIAALWGIRQIIVGNVKLFPTLVDFVTLLLYLIVVTIAVRKWLFGSTPRSGGYKSSNLWC